MSVIEPESGIWYGLCWLVVLARLASRRIHRGAWKNLQVDDGLIVLGMLTDTVVYAVMHLVVERSSNLIAPGEDVSSFSQSEIDGRIFGSKLVLVVEQMQIATVWLMKACLLIMYNRMTLLLPQHKIVLGAAIYVAVGFVVMEILYFGVWCRPFEQYWAVPTNSTQCSAATNHLIANAVFNISSDLLIISIPMPLLFKVKLPKKNKAILMGVFLIGTFTIVAAVCNKYYSFMNPFGIEWTIWYLRESFTAILCANLPLTYPLIQRIFKLKNWSHQSYGTAQYGANTRARGTLGTMSAIKSNIIGSRIPSIPDKEIRRAESQERINDQSSDEITRFGNTTFITSAIEMDEFTPKKSQISVEKEITIDRSLSQRSGDGRDRAVTNFNSF